MVKRAFIIHGWGGSPKHGWEPWLKNELEKRGLEVYALSMPDSEHPKMSAWLEELRNSVVTPDKECYFVGHSLGCITILRYLETLEEGQEIGGVVLVAGFSDINITIGEDEDINEIGTFFETDVDFEKVKNHCKKFVGIHSDDDPYVPLRYADIFKEKLGAEIIVQNNMKHFSGEDGINQLPIALESVLKLSK
ncbi:MAG: serine hydrolase family protein [Candidatus Aenigmarchaeota archaeon]|nr:serine hydrolase family protein [Candidatus Aenigmarchaeota archaeon]